MNCFPDVNVWIALAVANHVHHVAAWAWYRQSSYSQIVFSRVTQMGFLRLLTNSRALGADAFSGAEAWRAFHGWRRAERITYAAEPPGLEEVWRKLTDRASGSPNFWTDAYLAAFALCAGLTLVTFDRQLARMKGIPVELLGA